MDWIAVKDTLPSANNGGVLYIVCTNSLCGRGIGVANYIEKKFTNIILSGMGEAPSDTIVAYWMPMPDMPKKSK